MGRLKSKEKYKIYKLSSSPCWWVRFTDSEGIERRRSTGHKKTEYTKEMVQRLINVEAGDTASNLFSVEWMNGYIMSLLEMENRSNKTCIAYETAFKFLEEIYGKSFNVQNLKRGCASEIQKHLYEKGLKNSSINHYISTLRSGFERLIEEDKIDINPLRRFKKLPVKSERKSLSREEATNFLKHVNNLKNEKLKHLIRISIFTGIRRSEILNIERSDVDKDSMTFKAINSKSKDKHKVKRRFDERIWTDFHYFLEKNDSQFPFKVFEENYFSALVKKCMQEIGLPKELHLHNLRHTFITFSIEAGTPIRDVQKYIDHASISTTENYCHDKSNMKPHINIGE